MWIRVDVMLQITDSKDWPLSTQFWAMPSNKLSISDSCHSLYFHCMNEYFLVVLKSGVVCIQYEHGTPYMELTDVTERTIQGDMHGTRAVFDTMQREFPCPDNFLTHPKWDYQLQLKTNIPVCTQQQHNLFLKKDTHTVQYIH